MKKKQWSLIIIFFIMFFFVLLTGLVFSGKTAAMDSRIYEFVFRCYSPGMTKVAKVLSFIGSSKVIVVGLLVLLLIPMTRKITIPVAATAAVSAVLNQLLKVTLQRSRPTINPLVVEKSFSYPSGHSMSNMALYAMLAMLIFTVLKGSKARIPVIIGIFALVLAIGLSRIYLGVHYPSDVAGGYLLGFTIAFTMYKVMGDS